VVPSIVQNGIAFPFDQILQLSSMDLTVFDHLDLIFFRSFHQIRGSSVKLGPCASVSLYSMRSPKWNTFMDLPLGRKS